MQQLEQKFADNVVGIHMGEAFAFCASNFSPQYQPFTESQFIGHMSMQAGMLHFVRDAPKSE